MGASFIWQVNGGLLQNLSFDVTVSESPDLGTTITEHPVEEGADVTDNVRVSLNKLTLELFVSNEPVDPISQWSDSTTNPMQLETPAPDGQPQPIPGTPVLQHKKWFTLPIGVPILNSLAAQEVSTPFTPKVGLQPGTGTLFSPKVLQFSKRFDAVELTQEKLNELRRTAQIVTVFGTKAVYENMLIESFTVTRNAGTGTGATFTVTLKEIRQVATAITNAPKPTKPRASTKVSKGSQAPQPTAKDSVLAFLASLFGGGQ